jgi:transcriptional regulator with XRE-family HTH domain
VETHATNGVPAFAVSFSLGPRLRRARESGRLSLADVAARTDLTKGFLSRVERDAASPSVQSLLRICNAVGLDPADLFHRPPTSVVRATGRPQLAGLPGASVVDTLLTPRSERHLTVLESVVTPGGNGGAALYTLSSETEVCFVLEGAIDLVVEGETIRVGAGDSVTFGAGVPHTWRNASDTAGARILWILAPALADPQAFE